MVSWLGIQSVKNCICSSTNKCDITKLNEGFTNMDSKMRTDRIKNSDFKFSIWWADGEREKEKKR